MITLFDSLTQEQANTFSLVLNASGIGNRVVHANDGFRIDVPEPIVDAAREAVYRYLAENPHVDAKPRIPSTRAIGQTLSGIAVALVLLAIHWAVSTSAAPQDYISVFGADARRILNGEMYRCATALVLHADIAHLAGNMVGLALFGGAVAAVVGSGVGWLMILTCGCIGNLMNALAYETGHLSVGASTAVFGALGILCARQAVDAIRTGKGWQRLILIFGAGMALLAFLGTSARSDVGAHLFGFFSGVPIGGAFGVWVKRPFQFKGQVLSGAIAATVLLLAWIRGVLN